MRQRWTLTYVVQTQPSRIVIQPGFLIYRLENDSNMPWESLYISGRTETRLDCSSDIPALAVSDPWRYRYILLDWAFSLIGPLRTAKLHHIFCTDQTVWGFLVLLQLHKCCPSQTHSNECFSQIPHPFLTILFKLLPDPCNCPAADLEWKLNWLNSTNLCTKCSLLITSEFNTIQLFLPTKWCKLIGFRCFLD